MRRARAEAILTEDGIYRQPWFLESLLELADDLAAAGEKKKRLAIMWELRGCPYCKETHLVNFAKPEISAFIQQHFEILQLNLIGSREVVDFDGEKLSEKRLAQKYDVRYTPTFQFFPDSAAALAGAEAARARGRPRAGLHAAAAVSGDVPLRVRARLREGQPAGLSEGEQLDPGLAPPSGYGVSTTLPIPARCSTISCASPASPSGRTLSISTFNLPSDATLSASLKLSGVSIGFPKIVMTLR